MAATAKKGHKLVDMSLEEMDAMWNEDKKRKIVILNTLIKTPTTFLEETDISWWLPHGCLHLSFIIDNYWSGNSTTKAVQRAVQRRYY